MTILFTPTLASLVASTCLCTRLCSLVPMCSLCISRVRFSPCLGYVLEPWRAASSLPTGRGGLWEQVHYVVGFTGMGVWMEEFC